MVTIEISGKSIAITIIVVLLGIIGFLGYRLYFPKTGYYATAFKGYVAEVYYSPACGCCTEYIHYLKNNGFDVKLISMENLESIKTELGIPRSFWSCHTTKIGKYFVEGHVPIEAIKKLLEEKPDIDGIALPGMPHGSPGMHGAKMAPFTIYAVSKGQSQGIFEMV